MNLKRHSRKISGTGEGWEEGGEEETHRALWGLECRMWGSTLLGDRDKS